LLVIGSLVCEYAPPTKITALTASLNARCITGLLSRFSGN
jgi:hypothetical protein